MNVLLLPQAATHNDKEPLRKLSVSDYIARTLPLLEMEKDAEVAQVFISLFKAPFVLAAAASHTRCSQHEHTKLRLEGSADHCHACKRLVDHSVLTGMQSKDIATGQSVNDVLAT